MRFKQKQTEPQDQEMSFLDHLEALRWHIIRSLVAVIAIAIGAFIFIDTIYDNVFLAPGRVNFWTFRQLCALSERFHIGDALCVKKLNFEIINTEMTGPFVQSITMALYIGIAFGFPYALWELWRFIRPALSVRERRFTSGIVLFSTGLFLIGLLFGYYCITPITIQFLVNYTIGTGIMNRIELSDYVSTVTMTTFSIALVFEVPMVVYFLSRAGILTPRIMREYRRHAIVVILLLAAIVTPTTDPFTMSLVSIPFYLLYELSIILAISVEKQRIKKAYEDSIGE